jgi:hypothetical protein
MIEPTITGFFKKPRKNCHCGLGERRSRLRSSRRGLFSVRADEFGMDAPSGKLEAASVGKCTAALQVLERRVALLVRHCEPSEAIGGSQGIASSPSSSQ